MKKRRDWRHRLKQFVRQQLGEPFQFGICDGAIFTAGAVEAMTDVDLAKGFRGYRTAAGGMKKLAAKGHTKISGPFEVLDEVPAGHAVAGDVVVLDGPEGECMGIMQGSYVLGVDLNKGVGRVPLSKITRAFHIKEF